MRNVDQLIRDKNKPWRTNSKSHDFKNCFVKHRL